MILRTCGDRFSSSRCNDHPHEHRRHRRHELLTSSPTRRRSRPCSSTRRTTPSPRCSTRRRAQGWDVDRPVAHARALRPRRGPRGRHRPVPGAKVLIHRLDEPKLSRPRQRVLPAAVHDPAAQGGRVRRGRAGADARQLRVARHPHARPRAGARDVPLRRTRAC